MSKFNNFVSLSKQIGERFDLIQSAGGNISCKIDDKLYIKSSGYALSDVDYNYAFTILNYKLIIEGFKKNHLDNLDLFNIKMNNILLSSLKTGSQLPSMETYFHAFLKEITIHTHPISVNLITTKYNYEKVLNDLFPNSLIIKYCTPGLPLSLEIFKKYNNNINIIFLQNHGMIVTSDDYEHAKFLQDDVINIIDKYLDINHYKYKICNNFSKIFNTIFNLNFICYLSDSYIDKDIEIIIKNYKPFLPDILVFCGYQIIECNNIEDLNFEFSDFHKQFNTTPTILYHNNYIYIFAKTKRKAKEIEEIFKSFLVLAVNYNHINYLKSTDLEEINNLSIEIYRKNLL